MLSVYVYIFFFKKKNQLELSLERMTFHAKFVAVCVRNADANRAAKMAQYMKNVAPFYGLASPVRKRIQKECTTPLPTFPSTELDKCAC